MNLKNALFSDPVLKLPDAKPFILRTDASDKGLLAVLLQYDNYNPFPIAYSSRKLFDQGIKINYRTRVFSHNVWPSKVQLLPQR